jgi:hypothetical protein
LFDEGAKGLASADVVYGIPDHDVMVMPQSGVLP